MLLTLMELSLHNEMLGHVGGGVARPCAWSCSCCRWRSLIGIGNFLVHDQAVPAAAPVLHEWGIGDYGEKKLKVDERDPIWMRSGNRHPARRTSNPQATELEEVIIFRRDAKGLLTEQIMAAKALPARCPLAAHERGRSTIGRTCRRAASIG